MYISLLLFSRSVAKDSDQQANAEVKVEHDGSSGTQSTVQKQKKMKERSTTQVMNDK